MKPNRKTWIHSAVAAALMGGVSAGVQAQALVTNTGQALVAPYYTVNNTWTTTFNIMNTSDLTLAVKVRFHEHKNSRDVLDFNVVMSPYDVWTAWVEDTDTGPALYTTDNSCTSPLSVNGARMSKIAYTGAFDDTGGEEVGRMREGYVELLVMGVADVGWENETVLNEPVYPTAYYAKHVNGVPRDCSAVDANFVANVPQWTPADDPAQAGGVLACANQNPSPLAGSGDPQAACDFRALAADENPLKGNVTWLHAGTGVGAGTEMIAVQGWSGGNFVTAQQFPWFLEPTFASSDGLWTVTGVTQFEQAVTFAATMNEWANNPATGAITDWVVTFPTKAFHADKFNEQIQAAVSKYRNALADVVTCASNDPVDRDTCVDTGNPVPQDPFTWLFGVENGGDDIAGNGDSAIALEFFLYDREERIEGGEGTSISPAPPGEFETLRFEANVIQWGETAVVDSPSAVRIDASAALGGAPNGWANILFETPLPVVAFAFKERDRGEAGTAYGQAMDNGYVAAPDVD
jgi:hypothetical protein